MLLPHRRHEGASRQAGHALVVAMTSLTVLSIGSFAAIQRAEYENAVVSNGVTHSTSDYVARAGLDHATYLLSDPELDLSEVLAMAAASPDGCIEDWIGESEWSVFDADPMYANNRDFGHYSVDLCRLSCSTAGAGSQLNDDDGGTGTLSITLDLVSTGHHDNRISAVVAATVVGTVEGEGCGI